MNKMYFLAALAVIAAGCAKEAKTPAVEEFEETPEVVIEPSSVVFTAGIDTKAVLDGSDVKWVAGDAITIWNGSAAAEFTTTDSGASATFTTTGTFTETGTYTALYPHDGSAVFSAGTVTTTLPEAQTAASGTFDPAANLAVASSSTTDLTFYNLVSYLKFTVPTGMDDLTSVSFKGNAGQKVAGAAAVNVGDKALTATGSETATLSGPFTEGSTYYLAIAPQTFTGGYTVTITRTGGTYTMVSGKDVTFSRATARNIGNLWDGKAKVVLGGSALGAAASLEQTLENENLFAAVVDLTAGDLTLTQYMQNKVIAPVSGHDFNDGTTTPVAVSAPDADKYITISDAGKYRIIYDASSNNLTIQSPATFVANKSVSYNNTVDKINPYNQEVTELWMWGGFNGFAKDADQAKAGFQSKYRLLQSAANPYLFVYSGTVLPHSSGNYNSKNQVTNETNGSGWLTFLVSNIENNVYAYGSTAEAVRNTYTNRVDCDLDSQYTCVGGQGNNRYAYFGIPDGANYVEVDIDNLTVVFKAK
ncbi:MAG: fimbrillin family protein [Bacteroidales bacterium]|nr:fimbrillin family protein [Bacteroidales bacterium]